MIGSLGCWLVALCNSDFSEPQAGSQGGRRATTPVRGVVHLIGTVYHPLLAEPDHSWVGQSQLDSPRHKVLAGYLEVN